MWRLKRHNYSSRWIHSRKWKKEQIFFGKDKSSFANVTCTLWDKIYHIDCADAFMSKSKQKLYEDLEFVYYILAKEGCMLHTNSIIYNYCMRSADNNGTSLTGLKPVTSNGLQQLISASTSMKNKFIQAGLYEEFSDELDAIIIKNIFQRIRVILSSKIIQNKKDIISIILGILDSYIPNWQNNKYYIQGFKNSEYNDFISYLIVEPYIKILKVPHKNNDNYSELLEEYNKTIILK